MVLKLSRSRSDACRERGQPFTQKVAHVLDSLVRAGETGESLKHHESPPDIGRADAGAGRLAWARRRHKVFGSGFWLDLLGEEIIVSMECGGLFDSFFKVGIAVGTKRTPTSAPRLVFCRRDPWWRVMPIRPKTVPAMLCSSRCRQMSRRAASRGRLRLDAALEAADVIKELEQDDVQVVAPRPEPACQHEQKRKFGPKGRLNERYIAPNQKSVNEKKKSRERFSHYGLHYEYYGFYSFEKQFSLQPDFLQSFPRAWL